MEDPQFEATKLAESTSVFPPHCRSHLKSETYRSLVRILSHCYENAELSLATDIDPRTLRAANRSHSRQATEEASCERVLGDFRTTESGDSALEKIMAIEYSSGMNSIEDGCFHDTEVKMDSIKRMAIERSGDASDDQKTLKAGSECNHYFHEENHPNEAEHIMEGNKVLVHNNDNNSIRSLDHKDNGNFQLSPKKLQEIVDSQQVMVEEETSIVQKLSGTIFSLDGERIGEVSKPKDDNQENRLLVAGVSMHQWPESQPKELEFGVIVCEHDAKGSHIPSSDVMEVENGEQCSEKVSEAVLLYLDEDMSCKAHKKSENNKDKATSTVVDVSKVEHEMLSKDVQMDRLPSIRETMVSPNCMTEDGDIEEGEICGDGVSGGSSSAILEDPIVLAEKVVDIQIFEETINRNKLPSIQANGKGMKPASSFSGMTEYASHESKENFKQNKSSMEDCTRGIVVSGKMMRNKKDDQNDFVLEERGYKLKDSGTKDVHSLAACASNQVLHDHVPNEYATGHKGIVSTEKETGVSKKKKRGPLSERQKENKRIKKRKEKAEKNRKLGVKRLKLHPVTVPKPVVYCRHYLKGRCQKGDKCKYSHDTIPLTKSTPCSYFAHHSCMKGDDCPFDHQLSKYPCSNFVSKGSCSRGDTCMFSHKVLQKEESTSTPNLKIELKPPLIPDNMDTPKKPNSSGTLKQNVDAVPYCNGPSRNYSPQSETLPKKTNGLPPVGINFLSFGSSSVYSSKINRDHSAQEKNDSLEGRNVLNQSESCLVGNSIELSKKVLSEAAPKGIGFLSFSKTSPDDFSNKKLVTRSSYNDHMKASQSDHSSLPMQASPYSFDASVTFGNQIQAMSKAKQNSNELLKKVQIATSKQTNFLFPKASMGNYVRNELVSSSSDCKVYSDLSENNEKVVHDKHESSSTILSRLPGTAISFGHSPHSVDSSMYRGGTPNSTQKAILSTLAFAAKYESLVNKNKPSGSAALSNEGSNEGRNENINKSSGSASAAVSNEGRKENIRGSLKNDQVKASKLLDFLLGLGVKSDCKRLGS